MKIFARLVLVAAALLSTAVAGDEAPISSQRSAPTAEIRVDPLKVAHTMVSGGGASWHAMGPQVPRYEGLLGRPNRRARGSGWGGNPPVSYTEAWNDLSRLASWLGFDFIRVEMDMKMYEPERGRFTWESDDMQALCRILDHCQKGQVDVFLTQMWADVEWNAIPGVNRLQSAPRSVDDFASGLGTLMDYLVKTRHYSCIRWLCIVNEPGRPGSWWQGADGKCVSLMPALHAVRGELDRRGLAVGLVGPDWTNPTYSSVENTPEFDFNDKVLAALDAHEYAYPPSVNLLKLWVEKARSLGIPFLLTEFNVFGSPDRMYFNQLINAERLIAAMNLGIDAFNRWSFSNRGDLDGPWQLVRTYNPDTWEYYKRVTPEPVPFYSYGIFTRFMAKHSDVLTVESSSAALLAAALRSPRGNLTFYVLNKSAAEQPLELNLAHWKETRTFYKYQVDGSSCAKENFRMNPTTSFEVTERQPGFRDKLPGMSITAYSTYKLMHDDPGITAD
jgi:hypothetical protein